MASYDSFATTTRHSDSPSAAPSSSSSSSSHTDHTDMKQQNTTQRTTGTPNTPNQLANDPRSTLLRGHQTEEKGTEHQDQAAECYNAALSLSAARSPSSSYFLNQLLAICGGCNAADAVEILAVSFILPSATDDLSLTEPEKGWLAGMIFVGMMLGGWIWGSLSDRYGRRPCLIWCLIINGIGGLLSAFAPNFATILLCRFVSGIGVGGSVPVVFTYFSEFLSTRDRGPYMVAIACCWMVGSLFTAGLAWLIIPRDISLSLGFITMNSWRSFAFLCAFPSITCAIALIKAPESPRWLLAQGRINDAKEVLLRIYQINWQSAMDQTDAEHDQSQRTQHSLHLDGDWVTPVPSESCRQLWCGVCCRRPPTRRVRRVIEEFNAAAADGGVGEAGQPNTIGSNDTQASSGGGQVDIERQTVANSGAVLIPDVSTSSHDGLNGIKYTQLAVGGVDDLGIDVTAGVTSNPPTVGSPHSSGSSSPVSAGAIDSSVEVVEDGFGLIEEERWTRFLTIMQRFETIKKEFRSDDDDITNGTTIIEEDATTSTDDHQRLRSSSLEDSGGMSSSSPSTFCSSVSNLFGSSRLAIRIVVSKTLSLFDSGPTRSTSIKLLMTWFFLAFGYYGLTLWMPSYFANRGGDDDQGAPGGDNDDNDNDDGDMDMYLTAVIGSLSALPANILSIFTVRWYGRIKTLVASLLLSGICVLLVPIVHSSTAAMVMLCIFSGVNTASWNALNISTTELYNTQVRATAFGFFAAMGRIGALLGNVMFGNLSGASIVLPLFVTGGTLVVAAISGAMLPETKDTNLA